MSMTPQFDLATVPGRTPALLIRDLDGQIVVLIDYPAMDALGLGEPERMAMLTTLFTVNDLPPVCAPIDLEAYRQWRAQVA